MSSFVGFSSVKDCRLLAFFLVLTALVVHPAGAKAAETGEVTQMPFPRHGWRRKGREY
jgi:hypothetical protein